MIKVATLLFTYHRSYHTKQVIESLKRNTVLPQKLFVFQDGVKEDTDKAEWNRVNDLICGIDWCDKEIIVSKENKGLAASIVSGTNYAFEEYDAVIVLEDDCVPTVNYISFMYQCFEKYAEDKRVYSVSGYAWPISLEKCQYDVYGCGRISSWGWGTWRDRWKIYEKDYELIRKMKQDAEMSKNLAIWGQDLEDTVVGNVKGTCDSWAVFWALNVIAKGGICINPYQSFIKNIGMDGSGIHCGITDRYDVKCIDELQKIFDLPDGISVLSETARAFVLLHGSYTAVNDCIENREKILVYGVGNFYLQYEQQINEEYFVEGFVDRYKKGYFAGKKIYKLNEIKNCVFEKIVIMVRSEIECSNIIHILMENYDISEEKIELGISKYKI